MPGRINLDHLPRIPEKDQGLTNKVTQTAEQLKELLAANKPLNLYQRGWLAQYDEVWGHGELKSTIFEEITTTTTTQRRAIELQQEKLSPDAEMQRYEGQRLDRVLGVISDVQKESTRALGRVLDEITKERIEMKDERNEMRQFVRQIFMDQRSLTELAFQQLGAAHKTSLEAMDVMKEGIRAKGEAEAVGIAVQAQANAAAQEAQKAQANVKDTIKNKLEDTLLVGLANKFGLDVPLPTNGKPPETKKE